MDRQQASRARQQATRAADSLRQTVGQMVAHHQELTPGKATRLLVRCGKKNCRCASGQKHVAHFLYLARGGPLRRIWIPKTDLTRLTERSGRYRRFRTARAQLNKTFHQLLTHLDELEAALTVPYRKEP